MITVLSGPVVDSFDKEFRILFAASLPAPDTWRVTDTHTDMTHQLKDFSDLRFQKHLPLDYEITSPPSPPADSLLDWEAMGVIQRESYPDSPLDQHDEIIRKQMPLQNNMLFDKKTPIMDVLTHNGDQFVDKRRYVLTKPILDTISKLSLDQAYNHIVISTNITLLYAVQQRFLLVLFVGCFFFNYDSPF